MALGIILAAMASAPLVAQTAGSDPAQILPTSDTSSPEPIGDQAAIDGDTAVVLGGPVREGDPVAPLRVVFMERSATGQFVESQAIDLPSGTNPLGDGSVAIDGDVAAVFVRRNNPAGGPFRTWVNVFERDGSGTWALTARFDGATPLSDLGAPNAVAVNGDDVLVLESTVLGVRVLRRTGGPGSWAEVQAFGIPGFALPALLDVSTAGDLVVFTDRDEAYVFERDGADVWQDAGPIAAPAGETFSISCATDGERIALNVEAAPGVPGSFQIYSRPDPSQPTFWTVEATLQQVALATVGFQSPLPPTGSVQRFFLREDTLLYRARGACGGDFENLHLQSFRRDATTGAWFRDNALCLVPLAGRESTRLLDFDGTTAIVGDRLDGTSPGSTGAIAFAPILNAGIDCDLDGVPDADQIASCSNCDLNGNGRLDACEQTGLSSCDFDTPNSSGRVARLFAFGESFAMGTPMVLRAVDTSTNTFGLLISGDRFSNQPVALGNGFRCIGGSLLGRFDSQIGFTGPAGAFDTIVDPQAIPTAMGQVSLTAGTTWVFQGWFRDGISVNLTNAIGLRFD
ncbi:MAG: hypothetical protein AAF726_03650 [Planctomycetota bacterium]